MPWFASEITSLTLRKPPALDVQEVGPGSREGGLWMQNEKGVIMQQRR